nr:hypothetical protein BaRGS_015362 [Batillaria attramentaria]
MEAVVECAAILSKDHVCSGCDTTPATTICLNCGDMMCTVCTKTHKKFSMSKHHDVEDLATMTAERLAANRRLPCSVHADKTSELYCPTHGAVICQLCATSKHRAYPEVTELEEKMQEARAVLAELAATLKAGESKLEGAISKLDQYLVDMEKATQAALADIDHKCDRLQSCVESCRKRLKELAKGANCEAKKMTTSWRFHTNHGKNFVLSNNRQTAERVRGKIDAIVISKRVVKSCDDIADSLPTDLAMEARVECAAILSKKHVCGGCQTSPATSICLNCGDMMCTVCTKSHKNFSATKHHDVEDLATMTAERLAANRRLPCSVHADKTSELYCPTHGAVICHLCATSKHRACPEVTELEEKMQEARAVLAELAATLKAGESKLEGAIRELDQYLVDMEKATRAALADIDRKCDRLQSCVEAFRKRMKQLAKGANCEAIKMCPLCRDVIADATERAGKSCDDIADSLPTDLAMEARVECAAILSKDHVCSGCDTSPVTSICLNCGDMMCTVCTKTHKKLSATKHHDVEDLATMTAERLAANRRLPCSVHADKTSELYCPTHGAVICQLCATSKHRACPEVTELEENMQEARAVLAELAATLKAGESKLEGAISELDQYLVDMEKTTRAALADIDHTCDRLQSCVESCRKRLKELAKGANCEAKKMVVARKTVVIDEKALARIERELSQLGQLSVTPAVKVASTPSAPGVTGDMAASQAVGQSALSQRLLGYCAI